VRGVRFDDRIVTVLAQPETDPLTIAAKWHQLVDLLAQRPESEASPELEQALDFLRTHRDSIFPVVRRRIAGLLAGRMPSHLERFFTETQAPAASPTGPEPAPRLNPSAEKTESHIRDLVARLESFRNGQASASQVKPGSDGTSHSFRWETGADGVILWVEGAPRGAVVGQTIASPAAAGALGVDGQVAGAFKRRAPFRDARFSVAGSGGASGDWRISGVPFFDSRLGHFLGYRGSARRPRIDESAAPSSTLQPAGGLFGTDLHPDSLRQLIHELRTPLNAIVGFAEMIDGEYLGPAAKSYRARASAIREEAGRLLSAVDDLDTAARIETSSFPVEESMVDLAALLHQLHEGYARVATGRRAELRLDFAPELPPARVEPASAERMIARMLAATIGLAGDGEVLSASMTVEGAEEDRSLCLSITRPTAIAGRAEHELLDPGYTPDGDWPEAPALGLGFALRLVRNLAETVGGSLIIGPERFFLNLPAARSSLRRGGEGR
jgi:hypothetical protein